jgi:transposase
MVKYSPKQKPSTNLEVLHWLYSRRDLEEFKKRFPNFKKQFSQLAFKVATDTHRNHMSEKVCQMYLDYAKEHVAIIGKAKRLKSHNINISYASFVRFFLSMKSK